MRLIDADAVAEAINDEIEITTEIGTHEADVCKGGLIMGLAYVNTAPTIDAAPQWIPCEDGMPKKEIPYQRRGYYLTTNAYGNVELTRYEFEDDFQKTGWQSDIRIVAWMQLPKPYAERKDDGRTD